MELLAQFVDIVLHLDRYLSLLLAEYGTLVYALLFLIIFCETGLVIMPFLPGDSLLFVAGALCAGAGLDILILTPLLIVASIAGDNCNYWIGHWAGSRVFRQDGGWLLNRKALIQTEVFYARHGGKTVVIARFVPLIRTFAPFVAGIGRMAYPRFFLFAVAGAVLWVGSLTVGGYLFGNLPWVRGNLSAVIFGIIGLSLVPVVLAAWRGRRMGKAERVAE